jgi:hypothetical protein
MDDPLSIRRAGISSGALLILGNPAAQFKTLLEV